MTIKTTLLHGCTSFLTIIALTASQRSRINIFGKTLQTRASIVVLISIAPAT
jgi:hypothetical protein